jgi:hypothetical protein
MADGWADTGHVANYASLASCDAMYMWVRKPPTEVNINEVCVWGRSLFGLFEEGRFYLVSQCSKGSSSLYPFRRTLGKLGFVWYVKQLHVAILSDISRIENFGKIVTRKMEEASFLDNWSFYEHRCELLLPYFRKVSKSSASQKPPMSP